MDLYTKNGRPLQVSGNMVYSGSGIIVGRIDGKKVFGPNGRYVEIGRASCRERV